MPENGLLTEERLREIDEGFALAGSEHIDFLKRDGAELVAAYRFLTSAPDEAEIGELERLEKDATPGDWYRVETPWLPPNTATYIISGSSDPHAGKMVCDFHDDGGDLDDDESLNDWADAAFICALRNKALPLIRRLQANAIAAGKERDAFESDKYNNAAQHINEQKALRLRLIMAEAERNEARDELTSLKQDLDRLASTNSGLVGEVEGLRKELALKMPVSDEQRLCEVVAYLGIEDSDATPLEEILRMRTELFRFIEHGDENHRQWLKDKLEEYFVVERVIPTAVRRELGLPEIV